MVNIDKGKAKVISFPNQYGRDQFIPFLNSLGKRAESDPSEAIRFGFLLKGLDYMQYVDFDDLPADRENFLSATLEINIDGKFYSKDFRLVKMLNRPGIYELRISEPKTNWHFRGIFFPYKYEDEQFYCFVFPVEKAANHDLTNIFRDRAYTILKDLQRNPEKYISNFNV